MALTFRPATPADAPAIAPLVYRSGPAAFDHAFARGGRSAVDFLRWTLAREAGEFGYRLHWVGEQDGRIVATGTAFSGEANLRNSLAALGQIVGFYGFGAAAVIRRGLQLERIIQPPPAATCYLAHLGVAEGLTGQGIGQRLIDHLLHLGRHDGLQRAALDVSAANPRAQALYERLGFVVEHERPSLIPGIAAHRFMARSL
ncbi:GNAT family N-acetyltransferase [Pseudomonas sp. PDM13]|uniref:GNAT family N-acetyltransferase n=1 Tax=Pseudomonas sp. PDM13 TaxID=2769255 RepID=UPI0021E0D36D|nr:GNAT family N-acetyltransferase [Pseudomonas sp. PDM13]MCU9950830.1 GNAT family N-acetyltransferase [Pseudomonas sp. PDM13]